MIIRVALGLIIIVSPLFVGGLFQLKSIIQTYLTGQLTVWALLQFLAVPMILFRISFSAFAWFYTVAVLFLSIVGALRRGGMRFEWPEISVFLILAFLVIIFQAGVYIFGMHLDEDDARWIAEANDAIVKDKMLLHNPATGRYLNSFLGEMTKDVFSPWPFYIAWISWITSIPVVVMAHTVLPPVLLFISYCVYYCIGEQLFRQKSERGLFLLMVTVINLFMAGNVYTQSVFSLVRIWQGKAMVAAFLIPVILLVILLIQQEDSVQNWLLLLISGCAGCLFSGMGIAIGLIMIAVYGAYVVICRRWKRMPLWLLSMVPPIVFGAGYFMLK